MHKFGIFAWIGILLSLMVLRFDGDDDGGVDGDTDIGDTDIGDNEGSIKNSEGDDAETITVAKSEYEKTTSAVGQLMQEKLYNETIGRIKRDLPEFDADKVVTHLKEMAKTDPARAAQYNNEVGFKLLWREEFEGKSFENDPHNNGNNGADDVDLDDLRSKASSGSNKAFDALLDASKA